MNLRDHPLLSFAGRRSWPPLWSWIGGDPEQYLKGEIGVLREARHPPGRAQKCFLVMEHEGALYMGCLLIGDHTFCEQVFDFIKKHRGLSIEAIGSLDIAHLL